VDGGGTMPYSAFISYKSEDRAWASKLVKSLAARGMRDLFFDKDRLEAGFEWPQQLSDALKESKHAVFLISKHAISAQSYVTVEHGEFLNLYYKPARDKPTEPQRRMIYVLLEGDPPLGAAVHGVPAIKDDPRGLYAGGADKLSEDDPVWQSVVRQVANAISADDSARSVGCFVLAASKSDFLGFNFDTQDLLDSLTDAITKAQLTKEAFIDRYGAQPESWKPFGLETVGDMLDKLKDRVNEKLKGSDVAEIRNLSIRLDTPDAVIWNKDPTSRDREIARWINQPLIVVIDPLSLYIPKVVRLLHAVTSPSVLASGQATVMVLGPRKAPDVNLLLLKVVQSVAIELHRVFEPEFPVPQPQLLAGVNIDDETEMQRLMVRTVATLFRSDSPTGQAQQAEVIRMARRP